MCLSDGGGSDVQGREWPFKVTELTRGRSLVWPSDSVGGFPLHLTPALF